MTHDLRQRLIADMLDYLDDESKELLETNLAIIGSVKVVLDDKATGQSMSELRKSKNIKTSELAAKMKISDVMLRKLEAGTRGWSLDRIKQYQKMVEKLSS